MATGTEAEAMIGYILQVQMFQLIDIYELMITDMEDSTH